MRSDEDLKFAEAVQMLPVVPSIDVLSFLSTAAYSVPSHVKSRGKELQRIHGLDAIPPVSEIEWAAGLWEVIRNALIAENKREM